MKQGVVMRFLVVLMLVLIFFTNTIFNTAQVKGTSMEPTIHNGDVVIISKVGDYSVGDVVTVWSDRLNETLCKRVIGLEGDIIEIKEGLVFRNDCVIMESFNKDVYSDYPRTKVKKGNLFVLGDNRTNSLDSRELGQLKASEVRGRVVHDVGVSGYNFKLFGKGIMGVCLLILIYMIFDSTRLCILTSNNKRKHIRLYPCYSDINKCNQKYIGVEKELNGLKMVKKIGNYYVYRLKDFKQYIDMA